MKRFAGIGLDHHRIAPRIARAAYLLAAVFVLAACNSGNQISPLQSVPASGVPAPDPSNSAQANYLSVKDAAFFGQLDCNGDAQIGFVCSGQGSASTDVSPMSITQRSTAAIVTFSQNGADRAFLCFKSRSSGKAFTFTPAPSNTWGDYSREAMQFSEPIGTVYDVYLDSVIETHSAGDQDPGRTYTGTWNAEITASNAGGSFPTRKSSGGC